MGCNLSAALDPTDTATCMWVCDIEERPGELDCDFLFEAEITSDGTALATSDVGVCIFQRVMYDVNAFAPDVVYDGKLDFDVRFGARTRERSDAPDGWLVHFHGLTKNLLGHYIGMVRTSWWGDRRVTLKPYKTLTECEKRRYPDWQAVHYKSKKEIRAP